MFSMDMKVNVPAEQSPGAFREELTRLGAEEGVDIEIHPEA